MGRGETPEQPGSLSPPPTEDEFVAQWQRFGGTEAEIRAEYRRCMAEDAKRGNG